MGYNINVAIINILVTIEMCSRDGSHLDSSRYVDFKFHEIRSTRLAVPNDLNEGHIVVKRSLQVREVAGSNPYEVW